MNGSGQRLPACLAVLLAALAAVAAPTRGTQALMTGSTRSAGNVVTNVSLVSPTALTASGERGSVTLSWTGATPNSGNGNGYAIEGMNNGSTSACPTTVSSYSWVGSTGSSTTTFTDSGSVATGAVGTYACYLVQTGYSPAAPPWAGSPLWTSQGSLATVAFALPGIGAVQAGTEASGGSSVTATLGTASQGGDLLVATVVSGDSTLAFSGPAGWARAVRSALPGTGAVEIWYLANASTGVTSATFTDAASTAMRAQLSEFSGVATVGTLDATGTVTVASAGKTATVSTSAATGISGELGVTVFLAAGGRCSFTSLSGWTNLVSDGANDYVSDYAVQSATGVDSETMICTKGVTWAGAIATFK